MRMYPKGTGYATWSVVTTQQKPPSPLLGRLEGIAAGRGLDALAAELAVLRQLTAGDMEDFEASVAQLPRRANLVAMSGHHLLDLGGKRLRPLCVALAARVGCGWTAAARELAVAVELVHSATLLHDDVIDLGNTRRGTATARAIYGNAASIYAGDWLLVEALRRVRRARVPGTLDGLLDTIEEMIFAEAIQLEHRGRVEADRAAYFAVVEGKTAALFRWAMAAGGRAGGLDDDACRALESYGLHLGVAFQAIDDLLDVAGDSAATGKALFADLREGKITFPLIVALERDPALRPVLREIAAAPGDEAPPDVLVARVREALARTAAVEACQALARERATDAMTCLRGLPEGAARDALATVAQAAIARQS